MSDEHSLWERIRKAVGHIGHWQRLEFNPEAGIPDVDFCIIGVEGKVELKHSDAPPVREATRVFGDKGLRRAQKNWIKIRTRNRGRVFICAQVGRWLFLVPGCYADEFNDMSLARMEEASAWSNYGSMTPEKWSAFLKVLTGPLSRTRGAKAPRPINLD